MQQKITLEQFKELQKIKEWGNEWNKQQRKKIKKKESQK